MCESTVDDSEVDGAGMMNVQEYISGGAHHGHADEECDDQEWMED